MPYVEHDYITEGYFLEEEFARSASTLITIRGRIRDGYVGGGVLTGAGSSQITISGSARGVLSISSADMPSIFNIKYVQEELRIKKANKRR